MKPMLHARNSARRYGGKPEEYVHIHDWFDQTKAIVADVRHRAILHSAFGIFLCEQVFDHEFTNSSSKPVSVRDIGEQHCLEDLGFIPSVGQWLQGMPLEPWMAGRQKAPRPLEATARQPLPTHKELADMIFNKLLQHGPIDRTAHDLANDILARFRATVPPDFSEEDDIADGPKPPAN